MALVWKMELQIGVATIRHRPQVQHHLPQQLLQLSQLQPLLRQPLRRPRRQPQQQQPQQQPQQV